MIRIRQRFTNMPTNATVETGTTSVTYVSAELWTTNAGEVLCPDLMRLEWLGEADNARGRFVRLIFWVLDRAWPAR